MSQTVISEITLPVILTEPPGTPNEQRINTGQHPTAEMQHLDVNESSFEAGYDSDGQVTIF